MTYFYVVAGLMLILRDSSIYTSKCVEERDAGGS